MESHDNFQHLAAGAHAAAGRLALALDTIEDDVRNPTNGFATTFSVVNTKENTMLVNTFGSECPFQLISRQLAAHAGGGDRDVLLELLRERKGRERIVTLRSLNLMLSATVVTGDAEACMWLLKSVFAEFAQLPSVESLMFAAQCVGQHRDGAAIDEIVQLTLSSPDIVPNHALLTAFLRWAVRFGECARAMAFVGLHVEYGTRLDGRLSVRLLKQLCVLGDVASVERLLEAINMTHSEPPDPKVIMLCSAHLAKFGLEIKTARSSS
jgi:hypothetical protein